MSAHRKGSVPKAPESALDHSEHPRGGWYRSASPLFRFVHGLAMLAIGFGFVSGAVGGQWMRIGTAVMGVGLLPFGLLILTNFHGEYDYLVDLVIREDPAEPGRRSIPRESFRYGFGALIVLVGIVFFVAGLAGGRGVTKPGVF